jgi:hypothetical protein
VAYVGQPDVHNQCIGQNIIGRFMTRCRKARNGSVHTHCLSPLSSMITGRLSTLRESAKRWNMDRMVVRGQKGRIALSRVEIQRCVRTVEEGA